jgi:hypothetical protein
VRPAANLRTTRSSVELAQDLVTLPRLLRAFKSRAARAVVDASELVRAEELSAALLHYVAARDQVSVPRRALIEEHRRAFTLFARAYDQTRRAISFLRYDEGDTDVLVPLLYKKR